MRQSEICNRVGVILEHNEMSNETHYLKEKLEGFMGQRPFDLDMNKNKKQHEQM